LIAFATSPGQTALDGNGRHSPFTQALLDHLATPGIEISNAMKLVRAQVQEQTARQQIPWESSSMTGLFYVSRSGAPAPAAPLAGSSQGAATVAKVDPNALDLKMWEAATGLNTKEGYNLYLDKYPRGQFAEMAKMKLAALSMPGTQTSGVASPGPSQAELVAAEATQATEDALGLDRDAWRKVQQQLSALGFKTSADGKASDGTRRSIRAWQEKRKIYVSGYLNKLQHEALLAEPPVSKATVRASDGDEKPATRTRSTSESGSGGGHKRQQQGTGSGDAAVGAIIGIGAGLAIGRALRR
jgi:uncharacterized caspase-like protein